MKCDAALSPAFASLRYTAPYNAALAASASTSSASIWSDTSSQASDDSAASTISSDSDSCDSSCAPVSKGLATSISRRSEAIPSQLRQNPRRTSGGQHARGCPPTLTRQSDRKVNFVDNLVDSSTQIVEAIWPLSSVVCRTELGSKAVLPLRTFIQETLRRSRTSYSTLQVALYYLVLIKPHVPKHDFTMEQPADRHVDRALQCGRRMFLAALILASKYLQDRNYSARAWSKISGLNTQEINQNEMAFLLAVNWKLHIADEVFQRWTDIVLKYTPPPTPPSPGGAMQIAAQIADWKQLVLRLNPELTNVEQLVAGSGINANPCNLSAMSPRSILNMPEAQDCQAQETPDMTPTPKSYQVPSIMEPTPTCVFTPGRLAPSLGRLPTPRLTPQSTGFCTPAVSASSQPLGRSAMGMAMCQANNVFNAQCLDRLPMSVSSSPQPYYTGRRSSLANSVSTASSPESMVSDSSRSSRSSSMSSACNLASATLNQRLSLPSRSRGKACIDRLSSRPTIPSVPEDFDEEYFSSSPESYSGPVGKLGDVSLDHTPLARRELTLDNLSRDAASDAARALQELHSQRSTPCLTTPTAKTGSKRSRPMSIENALQENVRDMLSTSRTPSESVWPDTLIRSRAYVSESNIRQSIRPTLAGSRKRLCCSAEAASGYQSTMSRSVSFTGPGMWDGILN
jgi:hypothetical protein